MQSGKSQQSGMCSALLQTGLGTPREPLPDTQSWPPARRLRRARGESPVQAALLSSGPRTCWLLFLFSPGQGAGPKGEPGEHIPGWPCCPRRHPEKSLASTVVTHPPHHGFRRDAVKTMCN